MFRKAMGMIATVLERPAEPAPGLGMTPVRWVQSASSEWVADAGAAKLTVYQAADGYCWKLELGQSVHRFSANGTTLDEAKADAVREATSLFTETLIRLAMVTG
jgi:hypothetical protein